jgi:hypothetical protein
MLLIRGSDGSTLFQSAGEVEQEKKGQKERGEKKTPGSSPTRGSGEE